MIRVSTSRLREALSDVLNRVTYGHERVVLARHGKDIAAVVSKEDLELLLALEKHFDLAEIRVSLAGVGDEKRASWRSIEEQFRK